MQAFPAEARARNYWRDPPRSAGRDLGWTTWPANVPVQVHFADKDPIKNQAVVDRLAARVRQSGSTFEQFDYEAPGHLFADPAFPAYEAKAAALMTSRGLAVLDGIG